MRAVDYALSYSLIESIATLIRGGAYAHTACGACGIPRVVFYRWLNETHYPQPIYQRFRDVVKQALDEARAEAEIRVHRDKPEIWLLKGPGRERDGEQGWSSRESVEILGVSGTPVETNAETPKPDLSRLTVDELTQFRALLIKSLPTSDGDTQEGDR